MNNSMTNNRIRRALVSLLLMMMLSLGTVFTYADDQSVPADSGQPAQAAAENASPAPQPLSRIVRKGKYYYYKNASGKIRKKKGFVSDLGNRYYVKKGGKIVTGKTFKVGKNKYRAYKNGVIATGIYKWDGKWNFSDQKGRWIKKESVVSWNGDLYYLNKKGVVARNAAAAFNNVPYLADEAGRLTALEVPDGGGSPVVAIAKSQVGIMTGKTYWKWYFHMKFIDTDRTPWCGTFVAWCYNQAGMYDRISVAQKYGNLGYVPSYSRFADKKKKWVNRAEAQPGDVAVFGRDRHVGIVEGISDGCLITIEGNAGPTAAFGCGKAGAVCRRVYKLGDSDIKGIVRP